MNAPKVSCVCLTRNRRVFLRQSVLYYVRASRFYHWKTGGECELVIVDGSDEQIPHTYPIGFQYQNQIRTFFHPTLNRAGLARNFANEQTAGNVILHWDDDDWFHPERIYRQVEALQKVPGDGFSFTSKFYHYHIERRKALKPASWLGGEGSLGTTFGYWKKTWEKSPFQDVPNCDDGPFQADLRIRACPTIDGKDSHWLIYMRHNQNVSNFTQYDWEEESTTEARRMMGLTDCDFYDGIGELLPVAHWNHPNAPGSKMHIMSPLQSMWARHHR